MGFNTYVLVQNRSFQPVKQFSYLNRKARNKSSKIKLIEKEENKKREVGETSNLIKEATSTQKELVLVIIIVKSEINNPPIMEKTENLL